MINDLSLIKAKVSKDWPVVPLCLPPRRSAKKVNHLILDVVVTYLTMDDTDKPIRIKYFGFGSVFLAHESDLRLESCGGDELHQGQKRFLVSDTDL